MRIALLMQSGCAADHFHAIGIASAVCASEHELAGVFFQSRGVVWGSAEHSTPSLHQAHDSATPGDSLINVDSAWGDLASNHQVPLLLCSASARKEGVADTGMLEGFELAGLGRWVELLHNADRCIQVKPGPVLDGD